MVSTMPIAAGATRSWNKGGSRVNAIARNGRHHDTHHSRSLRNAARLRHHRLLAVCAPGLFGCRVHLGASGIRASAVHSLSGNDFQRGRCARTAQWRMDLGSVQWRTVMIVTLHSTDKIVELTLNGQTLPARLWEGETASGIACHAFITRIAVHQDLDASEFERELQEKHAPVSAALNG